MAYTANHPPALLFVCLGNICRSPSAQAVMATIADLKGFGLELDSAGTAAYHINEAPDERAISVGRKLGYDLSSLRARQVSAQDLYDFDIIFAMDSQNLADLQTLKQRHSTRSDTAMAKICLFDRISVADPYYGDIDDFERMFAHIEEIATRLLDGAQFSDTPLAKLINAS